MKTVRTASELSQQILRARHEGKTVAIVPTMGALHEGHIALVKIGKQLADYCAVSIFVNPRQFNSASDLANYPRTEIQDERLLTDAGADLLFLPPASEIYPDDESQVPALSAGELGNQLEGASRPGHFDGVLTVVSRLLDLMQPDIAIFGEKDAQQLFLVKRMVEQQNEARGRNAPIRVVAGPTVREPSGLALSSRNRRLTDIQRKEAAGIYAALMHAADELQQGKPLAASIRNAKQLLPESVRLDYLDLVAAESFAPPGDGFGGEAILLFAGELGGVRLIDNVRVVISQPIVETGQTRAEKDS